MAEERSSEFLRVGAALLRIRSQLPPRLHPEFAIVEENALRGALMHDMGQRPEPPEAVALRRVK